MNNAPVSGSSIVPLLDTNESWSRRQRPILSRNQVWLATTLDRIWEDHFWDVPRVSSIRIKFGARWKARLGLIRWEAETDSSVILINALFRDLAVPSYVCEVTIAHEIVHYAHGFGSPLPRRIDDPHADRVIERELEARGLGRQLGLADAWLDRKWAELHDQYRRGLAYAADSA